MYLFSCCFYRNTPSYEEGIRLLDNKKGRDAFGWKDQVEKIAIDIAKYNQRNPINEIPSLTETILNTDTYLADFGVNRLAKVLATPANKDLTLGLVDPKTPNMQLLNRVKLLDIVVIARTHPGFFLVLLDFKKNGHAISAFKENGIKPSYIHELAMSNKQICSKLMNDHADIFGAFQGGQLAELTNTNQDFAQWIVSQTSLFDKLPHKVKQSLVNSQEGENIRLIM
jgi:hypothetical protein